LIKLFSEIPKNVTLESKD